MVQRQQQDGRTNGNIGSSTRAVILIVMMLLLIISNMLMVMVNCASFDRHDDRDEKMMGRFGIPIKEERLKRYLKKDHVEIGQLFNMYQDEQFIARNYKKLANGKTRITERKGQQDNYSPLIIVGGLGGSALMSQRNHAVNEPHWWCEKSTDPFQIWISLEELVPFFTEDCFVHDLSVELKDGLLRQKDQGVKIFGKDIGGMGGLESVLAQFESKAYYMKSLSDYLVKNGNYQIGKSLRGLTIDWRLGVREWASRNNTIGGDFFNLKELVEETYKINGNKKVSLLGHSMGGPFLQYFLATFVSQQWKDQFIDSFIPMAGAFDGSPLALILYVTGTNWGIPTFELSNAKKIVRQYASPLYMSPNYFPYNYPFFTYNRNNVSGPSYRINLPDIARFFSDAQIPNAMNIYNHEYSAYANNKLAAPNVTTHCFYGYGVNTITHMEYSGAKELNDLDFNDLWKGMKVVNIEDGDGTVPSYSLQVCDEFAKYQKHAVYQHRFFNTSHIGIVLDEKVFESLIQVLKK